MKIPVIGCGGIVKVEDVVEYMLAGASAVMIGYLTFRNPSGMIAIIDGLELGAPSAASPASPISPAP